MVAALSSPPVRSLGLPLSQLTANQVRTAARRSRRSFRPGHWKNREAARDGKGPPAICGGRQV